MKSIDQDLHCSANEQYKPMAEWLRVLEEKAHDKLEENNSPLTAIAIATIIRSVYTSAEKAMPNDLFCISESQSEVIVRALDHLVTKVKLAMGKEELYTIDQPVLQIIANARRLAAKTCQHCSTEACEYFESFE
ncbi:hypothetical protein ACFL3T_00225 [Patescibacteria group bacterium]